MSATWQLPTINIGDDGADAEISYLDMPHPADKDKCPCGDEDHTPLRCSRCGIQCQEDCYVQRTVTKTENYLVVEVTKNGKNTTPCIGYDDYVQDEDVLDEDVCLHCSCGRQLAVHCIEEI